MDIQQQLMISIFRFKKVSTALPSSFSAELEELNVSVMEMALMKGIANNKPDSPENTTIADLQRYLFITKAAVSQMYKSLEQKGYLTRDVDKNNRRKLIVTLTPQGKEVLTAMENKMQLLLSEVISRFGEKDTLAFINYINRFADIAKEINQNAFAEYNAPIPTR